MVCTPSPRMVPRGKRRKVSCVQTYSATSSSTSRKTHTFRAARQPIDAKSRLTHAKRTEHQTYQSTVTPDVECSPLLAVAAMHPCGGGSVLRGVPAPLAASCRPRRPRRGSLFSLPERRVFSRLRRRRACAGPLPRRPCRGVRPSPVRFAPGLAVRAPPFRPGLPRVYSVPPTSLPGRAGTIGPRFLHLLPSSLPPC